MPVLNVAFMKSSISKVTFKYQSTQAQRMNSHAPTSPTVKPKVISADLEISLIDTWAICAEFQPQFCRISHCSVGRSYEVPLWAETGVVGGIDAVGGELTYVAGSKTSALKPHSGHRVRIARELILTSLSAQPEVDLGNVASQKAN